MLRFRKLLFVIILFVLLYSIYINLKIPTLTEGFTSKLKEPFRPTLRKIRNVIENVNSNITNKFENVILKRNK